MTTQERLKTLLHYDPETGVFTWRVRRGGRAVAGSVAGRVDESGYIRIFIDSRSYYAQRLAFLYMTGSFPAIEAEHKNRNTSDNRWGNLREASSSQNNMNKPARSGSKTGLKGVSVTKSGRFQAEITHGGTKEYLGSFATPEGAANAYDDAARVRHGEFARLNFGGSI